MTDSITDRIHQLLPQVRADLEALARIPSISADPAHADDVRRSADAVAALLTRSGFPEVEVITEGGAPAVIARHPAPAGAPTVLLYAHHDVQPTGDDALWTSPPFEPTERDGRLYGRGAADDKAGVMAHVAAYLAHEGAPPVGVTVFVEGEEESGSPSLGAILAAHHDKLRADVIVVADSVNWDVGRPALTVSLRGLADCEVTVRTAADALHSGIWGGAVPDAMMVMVKLLATLHDEHGAAAVEGLHVGEPSTLDYPEQRLRVDSGIPDSLQLVGAGPLGDRLWTGPAITVIGIDATPVDAAANAPPPMVRAKVSLRVAPGGDAGEHLALLQRHLESKVSFGASVEVTAGSTGEPYAVDLGSAAVTAAHDAFREAWDGTEAVDAGLGGSIPFIFDFVEQFPDAAVLITGVEDPGSRAHGANESLHLGDFARVCLAEALLLSHLAR